MGRKLLPRLAKELGLSKLELFTKVVTLFKKSVKK
jgi:hypothetical protein